MREREGASITARHLAGWLEDGLATSEMVKAVSGSCLGGQVRRSVLQMLSVVCLCDTGGTEKQVIAYLLL